MQEADENDGDGAERNRDQPVRSATPGAQAHRGDQPDGGCGNAVKGDMHALVVGHACESGRQGDQDDAGRHRHRERADDRSGAAA